MERQVCYGVIVLNLFWMRILSQLQRGIALRKSRRSFYKKRLAEQEETELVQITPVWKACYSFELIGSDSLQKEANYLFFLDAKFAKGQNFLQFCLRPARNECSWLYYSKVEKVFYEVSTFFLSFFFKLPKPKIMDINVCLFSWGPVLESLGVCLDFFGIFRLNLTKIV